MPEEAVALGVTLRNLDYGDTSIAAITTHSARNGGSVIGATVRFLVAVAFEHDLSNVSRSRRVNRSMHRCVVSGPQPLRTATRTLV